MTLFFTTRFHLSNLVTWGSSNKLPRAQVSLNHEWEGLVMDIFVLLASSGMRVSPTSQWGGRAGLATGSPWGGCHCRVAPVVDLLCSSSAVGCTETSLSGRWTHFVSALSRVRLWEMLRSGSSPSSGFLYFMCTSIFSPHVNWSFREGMVVIPVQWIQWVFKCLRRKLAGAWFPVSP